MAEKNSFVLLRKQAGSLDVEVKVLILFRFPFGKRLPVAFCCMKCKNDHSPGGSFELEVLSPRKGHFWMMKTNPIDFQDLLML